MKEYITIGIEKLVAMVIIAKGTPIGLGFTYFPKLPKAFSENIDFQSSCGCNARLLCLRVDSLLGVDVWFVDKDGDTFSYGLKEIQKSHPMLFAVIFTHIFDIIENLKDE